MSKSRPLYGPLRCDASGRRHLVVAQGADVQSADAALDEFEAAAGAPVEVWRADAAPAGCALTDRPADGLVAERGFASTAALFEALSARLAAETMGLRLYAQGDEAFLWDVFGVAHRAGLGRQEVVLSRVGAPVRRVYCVHCSTMNEGVRSDLVVCAGCGRTLSVRDHFSRRLSAFMGVNADAEAPGVLPEPQALGF